MSKLNYAITTKFDNSICYVEELTDVKWHIRSEAIRLGRKANEFLYTRKL